MKMKLTFNVYGLNKCFKVYQKYVYIFKRSNRCILGWIGQKPSGMCPKSRKRFTDKKLEEAWKENHSEILLKLNGSMPRLFLAFVFSQRYIMYNLVRFLTYVIFYMSNCLYVKNLTKLYIMYLIFLCNIRGYTYMYYAETRSCKKKKIQQNSTVLFMLNK